jgi:hypothetical protein
VDRGARDDAPLGDERVGGLAHPPLRLVVEDELGGRRVGVQRVDGPVIVVEGEDGVDRDEVHVGLEVGVEAADVAPVAPLPLGLVGHLVGGEVVDEDVLPLVHPGHDRLAEVVGALRVAGVVHDLLHQLPGGEEVVAHRGEAAGGVAGDGLGGVAGLLHEADHPPLAVNLDDAELLGLFHPHRDGRHRQVGLVVDVEVEHLPHVHAVDVVGAEHEGVLGLLVGDDVEVLVDGVGRPLEPLRAVAHLGRDDLDVLVEEGREAPGPLHVGVERLRLVLHQHLHLEDVGVGEVGEDEVDDAVAATEWDRGLGTVAGERIEPPPLAAGQDHRQELRHAVIPPTFDSRI